MARDILTDEQVEMEIERLNESDAVLLARPLAQRRRLHVDCFGKRFLRLSVFS